MKDILTAVLGILTLLFAYLAFFRNRKKDDTDAGRASGTILSDLGYIKAGVDEIKAEQKDQRKTNIDNERRLTAVEESAKQAHKRIDELKKP